MLKRLAVVVFLAIILPIYGQEKGSQAGGNQSNGGGSQGPTSTPSGTATCIVKEEGTAIECRWPKDVSESKLSRLFSPENAPNIGLFIVGLGGVLVAVGTLFLIRAQVIEMRRQVTASHDGLRAWIGIVVRENEIPKVFTESTIEQLNQLFAVHPPRFVWELKNYGQTPAFIKSVEVSNFAYPLKDGVLNPGKHLEVNGFMGAGQTDTHVLTLPDDVMNKCVQGQMFWRISVQVSYEDAFSNKCETMVSFHYNFGARPPVRRGFYQDIDPARNYNK